MAFWSCWRTGKSALRHLAPAFTERLRKMTNDEGNPNKQILKAAGRRRSLTGAYTPLGAGLIMEETFFEVTPAINIGGCFGEL